MAFDEIQKAYLESIGVFLLIFTGTYLFSNHQVVADLNKSGFIIVAAFLSLTLISIFRLYEYVKEVEKEDDPPRQRLNTTVAGWIWIFWLIHSILFKDFSVLSILSSGYSMWVIFLVLGSYLPFIRENRIYPHVLFLSFSLLLFLPNENNIANRANMTILMMPACFMKILIFYGLYILSEFESNSLVERGVNEETLLPMIMQCTPNSDDLLRRVPYQYLRERMHILEIQIPRASWILFVPNFLIYAVSLQLILTLSYSKIVYNIRGGGGRSNNDKDAEDAEAIVPILDEGVKKPPNPQNSIKEKKDITKFEKQPVEPKPSPKPVPKIPRVKHEKATGTGTGTGKKGKGQHKTQKPQKSEDKQTPKLKPVSNGLFDQLLTPDT